MSSIKYKIWMLLPLMAMISCESILDKFPEDKITPETFFTTENELELYSNNFYVACISGTGVFKDYGDVIIQPILEKAISGQRTIPETDSNFDGWGWGALRDINFCLENIYRCQNEEVRNHYEGLARFFRAYFYFVKVPIDDSTATGRHISPRKPAAMLPIRTNSLPRFFSSPRIYIATFFRATATVADITDHHRFQTTQPCTAER